MLRLGGSPAWHLAEPKMQRLAGAPARPPGSGARQTTVGMGGAPGQWSDVESRGPGDYRRHMLYGAIHGVLRPLTHAAYRPTVRGTENVPLRGGVLLASNHLSFIDSFAIPLAAPRKVAFLAKSDYFTRSGVSGSMLKGLMENMGAVAVDRFSPSAAQDSLELALDVLTRGEAFGIYPEGTRSRDGRLYRGRTGVAWLALKAQVPVVPVGLIGTDKIQPVGSRYPKLAKVQVSFGTPISPAAYAELPQGRARRQMTDDVMDAIAALSGQQRAEDYNEPPASGGQAIGL